MGKLIFLSIFSFAATHLHAQSIHDNKRLVYLFGPQQQIFNQQLDWLSLDRDGCEERDIKIIIADTVKNQGNLYNRYQIRTDQFTVILVGKDGEEKYRSNKPVSTDQLFTIIDQMPLRKQEIKLKPNL